MKDKEKQTFEFSVIDNKTSEYPDLYKIALKEKWAKGLMYCDMEGFAVLEDGNLVLLDECGKWEYCPSGRFEIIPKDSVVLSKEEYERLKLARDICCHDLFIATKQSHEEGYKRGYDKGKYEARKETAEKFLQLAYDRCLEKSFIKKVEELSKQFGVEIKE